MDDRSIFGNFCRSVKDWPGSQDARASFQTAEQRACEDEHLRVNAIVADLTGKTLEELIDDLDVAEFDLVMDALHPTKNEWNRGIRQK